MDNRTSLLNKIHKEISPKVQSPSLAAQVILGEVLDRPRAWLLTHPDPALTPVQQRQLSAMIQDLKQGIPLPYVIGHWEFYRADFVVSPAVMIPRPETEYLVKHALGWLEDRPSRRKAADIGTGTGCISISLAREIPDLKILAGDLSWDALQIARQNIHRHRVSHQIELINMDLLSGIRTRLDLITANLPYIPTRKLSRLTVANHEPRIALDGGQDGLQTIGRILETAPPYLTPGGLLLLEIDEDTGKESLQLASNLGSAFQVQLEQDLAGQDRYLILHKEGQ